MLFADRGNGALLIGRLAASAKCQLDGEETHEEINKSPCPVTETGHPFNDGMVGRLVCRLLAGFFDLPKGFGTA
ncbi:hypothetical protein OMP38_20110 [Cohnella ginsengisoli]|uniref:Uncharacterized protein n=1 Tax=Cohnella ginsengisoli TaxID=425004 RepID=A0A9X4QNS8_9BACL|nr:hypothetical protein [Cohnella ginsengisoli]MDG0792921.1 hypothetical protein [Cohnella ginsengisoli]